MRVGGQRGVITIQRKVQIGLDKLNAPIFMWQDWRADVFCEVEVRRGKEQFDAASKQRFSEEVWRFRTRYDEVVGLDASMQVVHEGTAFNVKAVLPDGQKHADCIIECTVQDASLGGPALSINVKVAIEPGTVGAAYTLPVEASGGTGPYSFALAAGVLPAGVTFDPLTGVINGVPMESGTFPIVIRVADDAGDQAALPEFSLIFENS